MATRRARQFSIDARAGLKVCFVHDGAAICLKGLGRPAIKKWKGCEQPMLSLAKRVWAGSLIVLLFAPPWSQGAEVPLRKLRVAITSLSGSMAVPWLAREAGIFKKHGLEVEVIIPDVINNLRRGFAGIDAYRLLCRFA